MTNDHSLPWFHRLAVLTACMALALTIASGALVTTKGAGMAFPDYPTSDGHNMFLYPWLKSAGDKFLEHGHRLAGVVIGLLSMALAAGAIWTERRVWVKLLAFCVLAGVVAQGLLGGQRVLLNERGLAFIHGSFAALVFALMASVAAVTSPGWLVPAPSSRQSGSRQSGTISESTVRPAGLKVLGLVTCAAVYVQYVLGGLVRHRGMVLHEHLGFAFVAAALVLCLAWRAFRSRSHWLQAPALFMGLLVFAQLALGAGAWVTRFGFAGFGLDGYVPVYGSSLQVAFRTGHVLVGMLLFMTAVVTTVRVFRLDWLARLDQHVSSPPPQIEQSLQLAGQLTGSVR